VSGSFTDDDGNVWRPVTQEEVSAAYRRRRSTLVAIAYVDKGKHDVSRIRIQTTDRTLAAERATKAFVAKYPTARITALVIGGRPCPPR